MDGYEKLIVLNNLPSSEIDELERPGMIDPAWSSGKFPRNSVSGIIGDGSQKDPSRQHIHRAILPGGGRIPLLKTMQTSICEHNCFYCGFRAGSDFRRVTFTPDEMAKTFLALQRVGIVDGLFLSSGIVCGGAHSQDGILATAVLLRKHFQFNGYLHLKLMPGLERDQFLQAIKLADRVSINLESPNSIYLKGLAPEKSFENELLKPFQWLNEIHNNFTPGINWRKHWPSMTTQFVVGGVNESDRELLQITSHLMKHNHLSRAYFSSFKPVRGTPLERQHPTNPWREYRLYQASYLLRDYDYDLEDLTFDTDQNLSLDCDPKQKWAENHLKDKPTELNQAGRNELMHIPGIGPKGADRLLQERSRGNLVTEMGQLKTIGIHPDRVSPYILLNGRRPTRQPTLF